MRWIVGIFLAVGLQAQAGEDDPFCRPWNEAADDQKKPAAVIMLIDSMEDERADKPCLAERIPELVRWINRTCYLSPDLTIRDFSDAFVGHAWEICP